MLPVYAEATADRRELFVMAGGGSGLDSERMRAAKHLEALTPLFKPSDPPGALVTALTWPTVVQLQSTFDTFFGGWTLGPTLQAWLGEQLALRSQDFGAAALAYRPPAGLTPYPWQVSGAAMIAATGRVLITDEPGTGKTITTILGLLGWSAAHGSTALGVLPVLPGPVVVVCPASVVDPWVEAWQRWAPHVRAIAWRGPKRRALLGTADVYVTSYETARIDCPTKDSRKPRPLLDLAPAAVVIDECHLVKNSTAKRTEAVERLALVATSQDGAVVALSGTPITHDPGDLHPVLKNLEPAAYPSKERWVARYCHTLPQEYGEDVNLGLLPSREPEYRLTVLGQHRRVAKADVLTQLPPKVYSTRTVELPAEWRKAYDAMESQMLAELPDGEELSVMSVLAQMTRLQQLASAAADVDVEVLDEIDERTGLNKVRTTVTLKAPSWKVDALLEVLDERRCGEGGEQVVVFAPSRQLIDLAGTAVAETGRRVGYIWGAQTQTERTRVVNAFQAGQLDVVLVTTQAGGVGITLTAARTCVFLQRPWSLVDSIQAEDRLHRIGAEGHESIEVIDVIAKHTLDTRIRAVLRERAGQLADLVQDPRIVRDLLGGTGRPDTRRASTPDFGAIRTDTGAHTLLQTPYERQPA